MEKDEIFSFVDASKMCYHSIYPFPVFPFGHLLIRTGNLPLWLSDCVPARAVRLLETLILRKYFVEFKVKDTTRVLN